MTRPCLAPWARAATTNSRSAHESVDARVLFNRESDNPGYFFLFRHVRDQKLGSEFALLQILARSLEPVLRNTAYLPFLLSKSNDFVTLAGQSNRNGSADAVRTARHDDNWCSFHEKPSRTRLEEDG